jgi:hypothetical protein
LFVLRLVVQFTMTSGTMSYQATDRLWSSNGTLRKPMPRPSAIPRRHFQPLYIPKSPQGMAPDAAGRLHRFGGGQVGAPIAGTSSHPANLGDPTFCADHGLKYPYVRRHGGWHRFGGHRSYLLRHAGIFGPPA